MKRSNTIKKTHIKNAANCCVFLLSLIASQGLGIDDGFKPKGLLSIFILNKFRIFILIRINVVFLKLLLLVDRKLFKKI